MTPEDAYRDALAWFQANWDPQLPLRDWWQRLADSGWGFPTWPQQWFGKGLDHAAAKGVARARREAGAFSAPLGIATMMVAPTLMEVGTPEQQQRYLPGIANGTEVWCQLFSEPGAGSDLAGVQTRAVRDGDEWVVNGQKVWTSGGHYARFAILVARTNPEVPKHRGLSFFLIDMDQPGVDPRPLRQMTGDAEFNEVFLTDARARHENLVGGSGIMGDLDLDAPAGTFVGADGRNSDDGTGPMSMAQGDGAAELLTTLIAGAGRRGDAVTRQRVADIHSRIRIARYAGGAMPPSAGKLASVTLMRKVRDEALELLGPAGMLSGTEAPLAGAVTEMALWTPGLSIAGGTDEIQRNILGERHLGLPAEPRVDKDLPFKDLQQPSIRG